MEGTGRRTHGSAPQGEAGGSQARGGIKRKERESLVALIGIGLGFLLLSVASASRYDPDGIPACSAMGRPFYWTVSCAPIIGRPPFLLSGFLLDILVWVAPTLSVVELLAHSGWTK